MYEPRRAQPFAMCLLEKKGSAVKKCDLSGGTGRHGPAVGSDAIQGTRALPLHQRGGEKGDGVRREDARRKGKREAPPQRSRFQSSARGGRKNTLRRL